MSDIMAQRIETLEKIARQASIVRQAQKTYFRTRSHGDLHFSKNQESLLDQYLRDLNAPTAEQPALQEELRL
ncbi:MAG: hypothetical protein M3403_00650 [Gemmatimonadota bacterium]|nr:hypothetical protein [Gemmatimonadota bacterium]